MKHKKSVAKGDIKKLYEHPRVFNVDSPSELFNEECFEVLPYFYRTGQENVREMNPSDFQISDDDEGKEYVHTISFEVTKNHQGVEEEDFEPEGCRMYARGTRMCRFYLSRSIFKYLTQTKLHFGKDPEILLMRRAIYGMKIKPSERTL